MNRTKKELEAALRRCRTALLIIKIEALASKCNKKRIVRICESTLTELGVKSKTKPDTVQ